MKKFFVGLLLSIVMLFPTAIEAGKNDYIDENFQWGKIHTIVFIHENRVQDEGAAADLEYIFDDRLRKTLGLTLKQKKILVVPLSKIYKDLSQQLNLNFWLYSKDNPHDAETKFMEYCKENVDVVVKAVFDDYTIETKRYNGYTVDIPTQETSTVNFSDLSSAVITTYGNKTVYIPPKQKETLKCSINFDVFDPKAEYDSLFVRYDQRTKSAKKHTPRDVYIMILDSFGRDFAKLFK